MFQRSKRASNLAANSGSACPESRQFTAVNDFKPDDAGWFQVAPFGNWPNIKGVQAFHKEDADKIVTAFNSFRSAGQRHFGLPIYKGHPDVEPARYADDQAYGRIKELQVREGGLWGRAEFPSQEGKDLINHGKYDGHSPCWEFVPEVKNPRIIHPVKLVSVGLTNNPNIPVQPITAANSEEFMNWKNIAKIFGLGESATETDIEKKATEVATAANSVDGVKALLATADAEVIRLKGELVAVNGKITKAETDLVTANSRAEKADKDLVTANASVVAMTGERDVARAAQDVAVNAVVSERKTRGQLLLDVAVNSGTLMLAQVPVYRTNFDAAAEKDEKAFNDALAMLPKSGLMHMSSVALTRTAANGKVKPGWEKFQKAVNDKMEKEKCSYNAAWNSVKKEDEFKSLHEEDAEHKA